MKSSTAAYFHLKVPMTTSTAKKKERPLPDWDRLTFSLTETDWLYRTLGDDRNTPPWDEGEFLPFADISVSPAAAFMSYGLGVFEGLKAQRAEDGRVLLFRPDKNAERLRASAQLMLMAPFPVERFLWACEEIVRRNLRFVPPPGKGSFYLRPVQHAIEPKLGLGPCHLFSMTLFGTPVGGYFAGERGEDKVVGGGVPGGVRLQVLEQGRVATGGTGSAKAMGNYAGGIARAYKWKQVGFDDVLHLDAHHLRFVTETSGSNVFLKRKDGTIVTPPLDDQILPGVTRDSAIQVARKLLGLTVEERSLPIDEVIEDGEELFCTGTAWTVQSVREIVHKGKTFQFHKEDVRLSLLKILRGIQTGTEEDTFGWVREVKIV
jgi:branched-chain amino acid aminotransferase